MPSVELSIVNVADLNKTSGRPSAVGGRYVLSFPILPHEEGAVLG